MKHGFRQIFGREQLGHHTNKALVLVSIICLALSGIIAGVSLAAAQFEASTDEAANITVVKTGDLTPSQLEALYPMSPVEEAKIVHVVPSCPVIIDGVEYKAEDIHLFDGIRLRFIVGKDGNLYAFTTAKGLEEFQAEYKSEAIKSDEYSEFYIDMWYGGTYFTIQPGQGCPYLYEIGYDNAVSSVKATASASWTYLYDGTNFQGDSFAMAGGTNYTMLIFQGWNDRASSARVTAD